MRKATEHSQIAELELIAEYAPDRINETDSGGFTPLHYAALCDQVAAVSFLLSVGANVNQTSISGQTPLYYASNARVEQLLIDSGGH